MTPGQLFACVLIVLFLFHVWMFYRQMGMFAPLLMMGGVGLLGAGVGWTARVIVDVLKGS
jgi:hypothetical protein